VLFFVHLYIYLILTSLTICVIIRHKLYRIQASPACLLICDCFFFKFLYSNSLLKTDFKIRFKSLFIQMCSRQYICYQLHYFCKCVSCFQIVLTEQKSSALLACIKTASTRREAHSSRWRQVDSHVSLSRNDEDIFPATGLQS